MKKVWVGYWFKNWPLIYKIGYGVVITGIRCYFKKFQFLNKNIIPENAGIIYAVNHQNAFLDPILIAAQATKPTYFLTRADIFKNPRIAKILGKIYMLPIYRQRDKVDTIKMNEKTFDQCYDILANQGNLIIFPEGNHNYQKTLRPFKKGIARIALGAAEKYNFKKPICIIPLGLDYENHFSMNGNLLLNAGDPININDYYDAYKNEPKETINGLSLLVRDRLESLMINIKDSENYESIYFLLHRFPKKEEGKTIAEKFESNKKLLRKIESLNTTDQSKYLHLIDKAKEFSSYIKEKNIRAYLFEKKPKSMLSLFILSLLWLIFLPIHLFGLVANYLPYKIPVLFVKYKVKDIHFHSSLKMAIGTILFFLYWGILVCVVSIFICPWWGIATAGILPVFAIFNFRYWIYYLKLKGAWRYYFESKKANFLNQEKNYNEISSMLT